MKCVTQQDRPEREGWGGRNRDARGAESTPAHFHPLTVRLTVSNVGSGRMIAWREM